MPEKVRTHTHVVCRNQKSVLFELLLLMLGEWIGQLPLADCE